MPQRVKRSYDGSGRRERAAHARRRVLDAARSRFMVDGYAATTMASIAADAAVSVQAVYKNFENKPGLLKALFDVAVTGDEAPVPLSGRRAISRVVAEPDPVVKLEMFAELCAEIVPRTAPIQLLARHAAATDAEIATVYAQMRAERLVGLTGFATHLHEAGILATGLTTPVAADLLWTYNSPELYELLVNDRGWSLDAYRDHIATALCAALLR